MPAGERAKQFMPFAAVRGLNEALAEIEKRAAPCSELSEDAMAELDLKLRQLKAGAPVAVVYYSDGAYRQQTGTITKIDAHSRSLWLADTRIRLADIRDIQPQAAEAPV